MAGGAGLLVTSGINPSYGWAAGDGNSTVPAILGGSKAHTGVWPNWPVWKSPAEDEGLLKVLRSGVWSRAKLTSEFEQKWAEMIGTKRCLTTVNGTNALITSLAQYNIGVGDEVIVPPYTFVATIQAVLIHGAIPVFVDINPLTLQIDETKIEAKITPRTKAVMPVHILGNPANMTKIMEIARKHKLIVIEDACQAHLAEVNGKRVGSIGDAGCFSFQTSKNMPIGEGGAITSNDERYMDRCFSYHNLGLPYGTQAGTLGSGAYMVGTKVRFTEYQAAIGLAMIKTLERESDLRWENGQYLTGKFKNIPGITPMLTYPETTKAVYHLYALLYDKKEFKGMSRALFMRALRADGVPCSPGYTPLHTQPFIKSAFESKLYQNVYAKSEIDYDSFLEKNQCPKNDLVCNEQAIWMTQNLLLESKSSMDNIVNAIGKIHNNAALIVEKFKE